MGAEELGGKPFLSLQQTHSKTDPAL